MKNARDIQRMFELLDAVREGTIRPEEVEELDRILAEDKKACRFYYEYFNMCALLRSGKAFEPNLSGLPQAGDSLHNMAFWKAMAREEETAPGIERPAEPKETIEPQPKTGPGRIPVRVSRFSIISLALSAAALFFLIGYAHIVSLKRGIEVATLTDSIKAVWADPTLSLRNSSRLSTHQRLVLSKGIAALKTDQGVSLTIEGPAEFEMKSGHEILLTYGRLYVQVSAEGIGFTVETPTAKMIDLGTEFGVQADLNGSSELHVMKGAVHLFAGPKGKPHISLIVQENNAVRYNNQTFEISEIRLEKYRFVRSVDSKNQTVWRGQSYICLADIVGGGNGGGSGKRNQAIAWDGQGLLDASRLKPSGQSLRSYIPVRFSPYIDGIFIPASQGEPTPLRSESSELNLDAFLKEDTNGLVTLLVMKKDSDDASIYWFFSKEGAQGDPSKMPSLYFPRGRNGQPVFVTTAEGDGADTYLTNDVMNRTWRRYGSSHFLHCRYIQDQRVRMILLRFDIRQVEDVTGAVFNLCLDSGNRKRSLSVYGLRDGPEDFWDENETDYRTAPGFKNAPFGRFELNETVWRELGIFRVVDNRASRRPIPIVSDGSIQWAAKESQSRTNFAITNAEEIPDPLSPERFVRLQLGGQVCGADNPAILMHANAGITFDLNTLRAEYGRLKSFTALCGLSPVGPQESRTSIPRAAFSVLLDGQEVFAAEDMTPDDAPKPIHISLPPTCRYLTLIAAEGSDDSIDNDLCLFVKPRIHLEGAAN
ncbi:MAG: NPCBM/NEW2 domain-containing protein [Anaerohalosphaeraceae bacterium]